VNDWFRIEGRRNALLGLTALVAIAAGCAETSGGAVGGPNARGSADDSDLWNMVPAAVDTLAEVDLGAMRSSAWTRALTESGLSGQRDESRRAYGYDPFTDGDRLLAYAVETGNQHPRTVTVVRGRFDPNRVGAAFTAANPHAGATRWRDSPLWEGSGRAVALVTPRTLVTGDPADVRAAIDAAWGIVPDARPGPLGELRRAMAADREGPASFAAVNVTEGLRARAAGFASLPPGLRRFAARVDLGQDLNLDFTGVADTAADATAAADNIVAAARMYAQGTMVRLLGLAPVLNSLAAAAEGTRLHGHLTVPAEQRDRLGDKLLAVLQTLAAVKHRSAGP
jgi:hypothetical protein